jgi:trehalose utilization protein
VVVWAEGTAPKNVYPKEINGAIAEGLAKLEGWEVVVANLSDPDQGLSDDLLKRTDVLIWWGHKKHGDVKDALVDKIAKRVNDEGLGLISLHSSHFAKINKKLMGFEYAWKDYKGDKGKVSVGAWGAYKGDSTTLKVTVKDPKHPVAEGISEFTIKHSERYGEPYQVPEPQAVVFEGVHTLKDGKTDPSRVGMCWEIGKGRFFYLQAGHETDPVYMDENIRKMMLNAVKWCGRAEKAASQPAK